MSREIEAREHYSFSQLKQFDMCPRQYFLQRIEGIKARPSYNLLSGKSVHAGLEKHNLELLENRPGLNKAQIVDAAVAEFESAEGLEELDMPVAKAKDTLVNDIDRPVEAYKEDTEEYVLQNSEVKGVEQKIEIEVDNSPFIGYVDLVTSNALYDYKLAARRKSKAAIDMDAQLTIYTGAIGVPGNFVQLLRGKKAAEVAYQQQTPGETRGIRRYVEQKVKAIKAAKKSGDFPQCDPTSWVCKNCPYWFQCYGK